jgi:hypothetical protein
VSSTSQDLGPVSNGTDGWELIDFEWDDRTGIAICQYERDIHGVIETCEVQRSQPSGPWHEGWGN